MGSKTQTISCRHHVQPLLLSKHDININFGEQLRLLSVVPQCKLSLFNIPYIIYYILYIPYSSFTATIKFEMSGTQQLLKEMYVPNEGTVFVHNIIVRTIDQR